jgi:uncharacterized protein
MTQPNIRDRLSLEMPPFVQKVIQDVVSIGIDPSSYFLDHCCFRCETIEEYTQISQSLHLVSTLLVESDIGGRPIATFKLNDSIKVANRIIDVIELASPKQGSYYPSGLEHVEFVIDCSLAEFEGRYRNLKWNKSGFNKKLNPDLRLDFDGFSVKFHTDSLENVIRQELVITMSLAIQGLTASQQSKASR